LPTNAAIEDTASFQQVTETNVLARLNDLTIHLQQIALDGESEEV